MRRAAVVVRFPSSEWAEAFRTALNSDAGFVEASHAWEGDFLLLITPDAESPGGSGVHIDLSHGSCHTSEYHADARGVRSEFVFQGDRSAWGRAIRHELDPFKAVMDGTFRVKGNLAKLLRFNRMLKQIVEVAAAVPSEV